MESIKLKNVVFALIGIFVGVISARYFSKQPLQSSKSLNTEIQANISESHKLEKSQTKSLSANLGAMKPTDNSELHNQNQVLKSRQQDIMNAASDSMNIEQSCLAQIRPSHIRELTTLWSQKTEAYLENNDFIWYPRANHSFNSNIYKSAIGQYTGLVKFNHNQNLTVDMIFDFKSESEGKLNYKLFLKDGDKSRSSSSATEIKPMNVVGTDEAKNSINIIWHNGDPQMQGEEFKYFGIKIPIDLPARQKISLDLYGLHETLIWKNVGAIELERK